MKSLLTAAMLLAFSAAIVGCEAHAKVGDTDNDMNTTTSGTRTSSTYEKKTTTVQPDGDTSTKTEVHTRN